MTDLHGDDPQRQAESPEHEIAADTVLEQHNLDGRADIATGVGDAVEDNGEEERQSDDDSTALGELDWSDPRELIIGKNTRLDPRLDRYFIRSIEDRGVREPIIVRRRADDGALVVRKGKRRTLAAIEAGRKLVRVLIEPELDPADDDTAGQIERIVDQVEENDQRAGNTDAEHVGAVQELLDLGMSVTAIARRTHRARPDVKHAAQVARSALVSAAVSRYDNLTLDRAAIVADFDDGTDEGTEAAKTLIITAQSQPGQFEHVVQRLRDDKDKQRRLGERVAELSATGVRVVTERADAVTPPRISGLRPAAEDPSGTDLTEEAHRDCPGHAALITIRPGWGDRADEIITSWVCTDAEGHGHTARWDGPSSSGTSSVTGARRSAPMSEEDKAARRMTIQNNRDWESATKVRTRWLRETFLPRKTAPKDAARFIAATLAGGGHHLRRAMEARHPIACELLGMKPAPGYGATSPINEATLTATPARATMLTLAVLLGAAEQATNKSSWRAPINPETREYFTALQGWGYELSPVEQLVLAAEPAISEDDAAAIDADHADVTASSESVLAHFSEPGSDADHIDSSVDAELAREHDDDPGSASSPDSDTQNNPNSQGGTDHDPGEDPAAA